MRHRLLPWPGRWPLGLARQLGRSLLPSSCALCGARCAASVCPPCQEQFLGPCPPRCRRCANPVSALDVDWPCGACQSHPPAFDATIVAADYSAPLDQLVLQLKFGGTLALAPWFGLALRDAVMARERFELPTLLCPVPLGPHRLAERGFNQALEIARPLSTALGIALRPALAVRARETAAQSGVAPAERKKNMRGAFIVAPDALELVRGQHIGVVDDVMTSGATLHELAAVFKRFGAARVSNFVFARTPPH
ncbi:ComF family protein [Massilia sp. TSP1-1-2]|uniref:ComF family protein n=1 Tax=unclassified Massilia TaxID=2609279 RepID=UPI003CE88E91